MGRDIALALASAGADVVLAARSEERLRKVAAEVEALERRAVVVPTDIADADACGRLAETAARELGGVDILVANAAHDGYGGDLVDGALGDLRAAMDVNLFGTLQTIRAVAPVMRDGGGGRIVVVSTMLAELVMPGFANYSVSKAALLHACRHLAVELGGWGIRVNSVLPGAIFGRALQRYYEQLAARRGTTWEAVRDEAFGATALGYVPPSDEVVGTIVYLASDLARPLTGQAIRVNAGQWESLPDGRV
jgi:NAD(P)-dependent dehydrogenase (short-subunit alcohol dehydrogenase family)